MRGQVQELRLDSHNPNGKREAHFRIGKLSDDPFVVGDVFIDGIRKCLHRGDKDPDIDEVEGIGNLEFENVGVPAGHVSELNLHLYAALLEIRADIRDPVIRNQGFGLPSAILKKSIYERIERELIGREYHPSAAPCAGLWRVELRNVVDGRENVDDILLEVVEGLAVEDFRGEAVRIRSHLHYNSNNPRYRP